MEASFIPDRWHFMTRLTACWLLICAVSCVTGCASTRGKGADSQASSKPVFTNFFEQKKKTREIIDPELGLDEYDLAMAKFEKKEYDEAANDFKAVAKKFYDYPVEEDALFMVAECRFASKRYGWAQDAYDGLIKKYPSSRYLEKSSRRLYAIGAMWLNGDGNSDTKELIQVSATDVTKPESVQRKPIANSIPLAPNLFDKSRPLFDTPGNALKALKSVWLHDPLGPLADDAVMLTAVYYIRKGNFREADHWLDILRREYPKSEHTQTAFVVGSHIKLASYQGPKYDGRDLVDADDLIHSTLNLFPDVEDREQLQAELVKIHNRGAERNWARAEYYRHRAKPQSEAIYCEAVLKDFPDSEYAKLAAKRLQELGPQYYTGMLSSYPGEKSLDSPKSRVSPKTTKPLTSRGSEGPQIPPQRSRPSTPPAKTNEPVKAPSRAEPRKLPEEDPNGPYEELPPARQNVDSPEAVEELVGGEIEQTSTGRARP